MVHTNQRVSFTVVTEVRLSNDYLSNKRTSFIHRLHNKSQYKRICTQKT